MQAELSRWGGQGVAVVEVKPKLSGKGDAAYQQAKTKVLILDQHLRYCINLLEDAPPSIAIWKAGSASRKLEKTIAALQRERQEIPRIISDLLSTSTSRHAEEGTLSHRLGECEKALKASQASEAAAKSAAEAALAQVAELQDKLKRAEAAATAQQAEELEDRIRALESERARLQSRVALSQLSHGGEEEEEAADEKARLQERYDGLQEQYDGLQERYDGLQEQYDSLKELCDGLQAEANSNREAAAAASRRAEETAAQLAKASQIHARRLAETRAARDAAAADLEALRQEHAGLHGAFLAAGGPAEHQAKLLRQVAEAAEAAAKAAEEAEEAVEEKQRCVLLRLREGWCVHAAGRGDGSHPPCGAVTVAAPTSATAAAGNGNGDDVSNSKFVVLPYGGDAVGLEGLVREQGLFLCGACCTAAGGFFR